MAGVAVPSINGQSAIGSKMGGGTQIIGGKLYNQYSPEWYAAMRQNEADVQGAAGTAAGTFTKNYLGTASPALSGIQSLFGGSGSGSGVSGGAGGVATGGGASPVAGGPDVAPLEVPDMTAANTAAYAKAKDQVGASSRAALTSLRDELGATGALGGGAEVEGTKQAVMDAAGELGDVSRGQAESQANLAADTAKTNYLGRLTMRGQDIQAQEAQARLALEQRQQYMQMLQTALAGIRTMSGSGDTGSGSASLLY